MIESYLKKLKISSAYSHKGSSQRGLHHFDNEVYPFIATAINKGRWNTSEYNDELSILFKMYNVDPELRGNI